ncbi:hypothetical protein ACVJBD_007410 [Rhizobium mongolense]
MALPCIGGELLFERPHLSKSRPNFLSILLGASGLCPQRPSDELAESARRQASDHRKAEKQLTRHIPYPVVFLEHWPRIASIFRSAARAPSRRSGHMGAIRHRLISDDAGQFRSPSTHCVGSMPSDCYKSCCQQSHACRADPRPRLALIQGAQSLESGDVTTSSRWVRRRFEKMVAL